MTANDPAAVFRVEAEELLASLENALLDLGQAPDNGELVDQAFRALHTLKGSGAMFGFRDLATFLHAFETAFDQVRAGTAQMNPAMIDGALRARDHAAALIRGSMAPEAAEAEGQAILAAFEAACQDGVPEAAGAATVTVVAAPDPGASMHWRINFQLPQQLIDWGSNPALLLAELAEFGTFEASGEVTGAIADPASLPRERFGDRFSVRLATVRPRAAIEDVFVFVRDAADIVIEAEEADEADEPDAVAVPLPAASDVPREPSREGVVAPPRGAGDRPAAPASMRVATDRLDSIMNHVGELVIAQARLSQLARASDDANLKSLSEEIERLSASLRNATMGIRMVGVGALFGRFRRLVHDLSAELGRDIAFVTSGEETELDKTVIEQLADPLVHLIRNAADHGLEDPETRRARGKPATGTLRLSAAHAGAQVVITLADDGGGFDTERIRARAEASGLISTEETLSDQEIWKLVFRPGFSTRDEVTELSGRGVGMDVVRRTIEGLRGAIELASTPGEGSAVTLRLPLTLAIIEGLLVRVGVERYVIPLAAVEECVELSAHVDAASTGRRFINIRGGLLPYLTLRELFGEPGIPDPHQKIVVVSSGEGRVGLVVDQVIGTSQAVIKQLSKLHSDLKIFSGATILGDGAASLILDVMHLVTFGQTLEGRLVAERIGRAA